MAFDLDSFLKTYSSDIAKRSAEVQAALEFFVKFQSQTAGLAVEVADESADKIAALHFGLISEFVREFVPDRVSKFKMAAVMSFSIMKVRPLLCSTLDADANRMLNAEFASIVGDATINDMTTEEDCKLHIIAEIEGIGNTGIEERLKELLSDQQEWLARKSPDYYPIFSTAGFLEILWLYSRIRFQAGIAH